MTYDLPLVLMEDLTKVFRNGKVDSPVLNGIDLTINRGEFVVIFGPSGCGKSTLLAIMGLLDSPTAGVYSFNGQPVQGLKLADRARIRNQDIGFVFQNFNLIGDMSVYENVEQPLSYGKIGSSERKERVMAVLEKVGLADRARFAHAPLLAADGPMAQKLKGVVESVTLQTDFARQPTET